MTARWADITDEVRVEIVNMDSFTTMEGPTTDATVDEMLNILSAQYTIPVEDLVVTYGVERLTGGTRTLESYGMGEGSRVHLKDNRRICVFVVALDSGRNKIIECSPSLPVGIFKLRCCAFGAPRWEDQLLHFGGHILQNDRTLESYGTGDESVVWLSIRIVGGSEEEEEAQSEHNEALFYGYDSGTDDTASQNSLVSETSTLFNHRRARIMTTVAADNDYDDVDSQATALEWGGLFEPENDVEPDAAPLARWDLLDNPLEIVDVRLHATSGDRSRQRVHPATARSLGPGERRARLPQRHVLRFRHGGWERALRRPRQQRRRQPVRALNSTPTGSAVW